MYKPAYYILLSIFFLFSKFSDAQSAELTRRLAELKSRDSLEAWLVLRMNYTAEDPEQRINFLMRSQAEAWRQPQKQEEKQTWLNLLLNQGYYLLSTGNIVGSIEAYEKANVYFDQWPFNDFDVAEYIYKPLGNNYTRLGAYSSALYIQKKGLEYAQKNRDSSLAASFYNNLAISYRWVGSLDDAERNAVLGLRNAPPESTLGALLKSTLADIQFEKGNLSEAEKNVAGALRILASSARTSNDFYWLLSAETLAGNIALKRGEAKKALLNFKSGLQIIRTKFSDGRRREKANLFNRIGAVYLALNNGSEAQRFFDKAIETLIPDYDTKVQKMPLPRQLYAENRLYDALEGRGRAFLLLNEQERALSDMLLALQSGDLSRGDIGSYADRIYYQKKYKQLVEQALSTAFHLWRQQPGSDYQNAILRLVEQSKSRALADEISRNEQELLLASGDSLFVRRSLLQKALSGYETELVAAAGNSRSRVLRNRDQVSYELSIVEKEIGKKYPSWKGRIDNTNFVVGDLAARIPDTIVALNYFVGDSTGYNVVVAKGKVADVIRLSNISGEKERMLQFVDTYFRNGPAAMINHPQNFFAESAALYDYLIPKNVSFENKYLLVIPDDVIGYLAFESLLSHHSYTENIRQWPFLVKALPVSYAYSLATWSTPVKKREAARFSGFFITTGQGENAALEAAVMEKRYLSSLLKGSFLTNRKADLRSFNQAIRQSNILHISTHSFPYGPEMVPALQMSDGNYFLFQLAAEQQVPDLVVLSACRTADGLMAGGEGILSLARGFAAAGAEGTVSGLWNVNDKAAAEQMAGFYTHLLQNQNPAKALHQMKMEWLGREHKNPALLLPYYWAGMIYTGKMQVVEIEKATLFERWWWLPVVGIGAAALVWLLVRRRMRRWQRSCRAAQWQSWGGL